jgi:hypothetical protein
MTRGMMKDLGISKAVILIFSMCEKIFSMLGILKEFFCSLSSKICWCQAFEEHGFLCQTLE